MEDAISPAYSRLDVKTAGAWKEVETPECSALMSLPLLPLEPGKTYEVRILLAPLLGKPMEARATIFCDVPGKTEKQHCRSGAFKFAGKP